MDDILKIDINSELATLIDESSLSVGELLPVSKSMGKTCKYTKNLYLRVE